MSLFGERLLLVAGPCVVEGRDVTFRIAERLKAITDALPVTFVFKASFDKANRTARSGYRGPGMDEALGILAEVKREVGVAIITDVHERQQIESVAEVVDVLQTPALLCRQTDLLHAAGASGKPVLVKKGQFVAPEDMRHALEKVRSGGGGGEIALCERGTLFGYGNLVVDFRSLPILRQYAPVVFDATHSVQRPSGQGDRSGGDPTMVPALARAAAAVGIDGLFFETHEDPEKALCDGPNMIPLDELPTLLAELVRIREATDR